MNKTAETAMESKPEQDESMDEDVGQKYDTQDLEQTDVEIVAKNNNYNRVMG